MNEAVHLVRRFFGHVAARPLAPDEQAEVADRLPGSLARLFFAQAPADQRHAYGVARRVAERRPDDDDAYQAALLHDIGKGDAAIGPVARSLATLAAAARLPVPARWRRYLDHGERGAAMLEEAGAGRLAVAFTRGHPGPPPPGVDAAAWEALAAADET